MTMIIDGTSGTTLAAQFDSAATFGFKNRIINGAMVFDQRNQGASVTPANSAYTLDRWKCYQITASKFSVQQTPSATETGYTTRVAAGFNNYLAATSLSAYSVSASDYYTVQQPIEGSNIADLAWGTANAKTVTLSFLAYSSLTGTFGGSIFNSAGNRSYPFSYTISSANTWTQISVTIAGDTSGTWLTNNGTGIQVCFGLGAGSTYTGTANTWAGTLYIQPNSTVSVVGTNGATFYITGVQLEKGSTATSFDYRDYGTELFLCQRYLPAFSGAGQIGGGGNAVNGSTAYTTVTFPVITRVAPSGMTVNSAGNFNIGCAGVTSDIACTSVSASNFSTSSALVNSVISSGITGGQVITMRGGASALMYFTGCEL